MSRFAFFEYKKKHLKCQLPTTCLFWRWRLYLLSIFFLPSQISSWGSRSSQKSNSSSLGLMSKGGNCLGHKGETESLDLVSWRFYGRDTWHTPRHASPHPLGTLQCRDNQWAALWSMELKDLTWCFIVWQRVREGHRKPPTFTVQNMKDGELWRANTEAMKIFKGEMWLLHQWRQFWN